MVLKTENCEWQELMNGPYNRWQQHDELARLDREISAADGDHFENDRKVWGVEDMLLHACHTEAERAACVFGKLNQQIDNGGVCQWVDNGYAFGCIEWLPDYLPATGPVGKQIWELLRPFLESYMDEDSGEMVQFDDGDEDGLEWQDCSDMSDRLSSEFYRLQDEWHPEVYAYLAKLSEPAVNEEIVHRETALDGRFG